MNAGSYFRGGLSLTCPLPVGKERLPGYGTSVPKVLAPLHPPISMPPLLIGTRDSRALERCEIVSLWEPSGEALQKGTSASILEGPLKRRSREAVP